MYKSEREQWGKKEKGKRNVGKKRARRLKGFGLLKERLIWWTRDKAASSPAGDDCPRLERWWWSWDRGEERVCLRMCMREKQTERVPAGTNDEILPIGRGREREKEKYRFSGLMEIRNLHLYLAWLWLMNQSICLHHITKADGACKIKEAAGSRLKQENAMVGTLGSFREPDEALYVREFH